MIVTAQITRDNGQPCEVATWVYSISEWEQPEPVNKSITLTISERFAADDAIQAAVIDAMLARAELRRDAKEGR